MMSPITPEARPAEVIAMFTLGRPDRRTQLRREQRTQFSFQTKEDPPDFTHQRTGIGSATITLEPESHRIVIESGKRPLRIYRQGAPKLFAASAKPEDTGSRWSVLRAHSWATVALPITVGQAIHITHDRRGSRTIHVKGLYVGYPALAQPQ